MAGEPTLSRGDTGEWVTYLQQVLEYRQLGSGFTGGVYCEATEQAVQALQQQSSLDGTGQCDEQTWVALMTEPSADDVPDDIAISIAHEVGAPEVEEWPDDLEPLPDNATVA